MKYKQIILILILLLSFLLTGCNETGVLNGTLDVNITNPIMTNESIFPTLTHQQYLTHQEECFTTRMSGILASGTIRYGIFKSNGKEIHFLNRKINVIDIGGKAIDFEFKIYENVSVTTNGTILNIYNLDRNSNNINSLQGFADPTGINTTGSIWLESFGNRIKEEKQTSIIHSDSLEYIMKKNTYYLIEFSNYGATSIEVQYDVIWGEVNY